jgi:hypothetical protein
MKRKKLYHYFLYTMLFLFSKHAGISQTIQSLEISPGLDAHSEKWGIGYNGKKSDIRLAEFGPYAVTKVEKLDSGFFKNKVKEEKGGSYSSGDGYDEYKIKRTEKNTFFLMSLAGGSDSAESLFSTFTATREKRETVLGMVLSKKESSGGSETISESKQAAGMINIKNDSVYWKFFIDYPSSSTNTRVISSGLSGYLTNGSDTLSMKILYSVATRMSKDSTGIDRVVMRMARGVSLISSRDEQIAILIFKPTMGFISKKAENYTNDERVMINNEISKSEQLAIATLYGIMIGIQGY